MCNFGAQAEWRNGRRAVSSYLDVETSKDKYRLINTTPLDCITCYIMEDAVGDRYLKRLPQRRIKLIDGSISSYCSMINSTKWLDLTKQANELACVHGDIDSDHLGEKEDRKKIDMEAEDKRKNKY